MPVLGVSGAKTCEINKETNVHSSTVSVFCQFSFVVFCFCCQGAIYEGSAILTQETPEGSIFESQNMNTTICACPARLIFHHFHCFWLFGRGYWGDRLGGGFINFDVLLIVVRVRFMKAAPSSHKRCHRVRFLNRKIWTRPFVRVPRDWFVVHYYCFWLLGRGYLGDRPGGCFINFDFLLIWS